MGGIVWRCVIRWICVIEYIFGSLVSLGMFESVVIVGIVVDDAHLVFCGRVDALWLVDEFG